MLLASDKATSTCMCENTGVAKFSEGGYNLGKAYNQSLLVVLSLNQPGLQQLDNMQH